MDVVSLLVSWERPTATQAGAFVEAGTHDTATSLSSANTLFGEGWIDQLRGAATAPVATMPRAVAAPTAATKVRLDRRRVSPEEGGDEAGMANPYLLPSSHTNGSSPGIVAQLQNHACAVRHDSGLEVVWVGASQSASELDGPPPPNAD